MVKGSKTSILSDQLVVEERLFKGFSPLLGLMDGISGSLEEGMVSVNGNILQKIQ